MFKQPNNDWQQGFTLTFVNGWDISVKWDMEDADPAIARTSKTAEVAAFNDDDWWDFGNNMVMPNQETKTQRNVGSDQVADMIIVIKNLYLDEYSRWKNGIQLGAFNRTREYQPPDPSDGFASVDIRHEVNLESSP